MDNFSNVSGCKGYVQKEEYEDLTLKDAQMIMVNILKEIDKICTKHNLRYFLDAGTLLGAVRHKGFIPWDDDVDIGMPREDYIKFLEIAQKELPDYLFLQTFETDKYYDIYQTPSKVRDSRTLIFEEHVPKNEKMNNGLFIDVFPFDSLPKSKAVYKVQRNISEFILRSYVRLRDRPEKLSLKNKITFTIYRIITSIFKTKNRLKFFNFLIKWNDKDSPYITYGVDTIWSEYVHKKEDYFDLIRLEFEGEKFLAPKNYDAILSKLYGDYMTLPKEEDRVWHAKELKKLKNININKE